MTRSELTTRLYIRRKYDLFPLSFTKQITPVTFFFHALRFSGGAIYSWATDVARVCKRVMIKIRKKERGSNLLQRHSWSWFFSTYHTTATKHTKNFVIFILFKQWRWSINAFTLWSWHLLVSFQFLSSSSTKIPTFENKPAFRILCSFRVTSCIYTKARLRG